MARAVSLTVLAAGLPFVEAPVQAEPVKANSVQCALSRPDRTAAIVTARLCGTKVAIINMTNEMDESWANPDGSITTNHAMAPIRARAANGSWVPVDLTLRRDGDGSIFAAAHPAGLRVSGGEPGDGQHVLAAIGSGEERVVMSYTGPLPAPVLAGNRATYAEVRPGVDLVIEASSAGFEQLLIVRNRAGLAHVKTVQVQLSGPGVASHRTDAAGVTQLINGAGKAIAEVPAAKMWDAAVDARGTRSNEIGIATAFSRKAQAKGFKVESGAAWTSDRSLAGAGGVTLDLTPDAAWLADPARQFPITIDPSTTAPYYSGADTYVVQGSSVDHSVDADLQVGVNNGIRRAMLKWTVPWNAGERVFVSTASAKFYNFWSNGCGNFGWQLWRLTGNWGVTWATMPAWSNHLSSSTETRGNSTSCGNGGDGYISIDATAFFQYASDDGLTTAYMGIKAASETNSDYFKQFRPHGYNPATMQPYITATWYPLSKVNAMSTVPATGCVTSGTLPKVNTTTPTLRAQISNPAGGNMYARFEVQTADGATTVIPTATTAQYPSGSTVPYVVPAAKLVNGQSYRWHAAADDNHIWSGDGLRKQTWSPWCHFTVDTTAPSAPAVSSSDYPAGLWSKSAGSAGEFSFSPGAATDVTSYDYQFDSQTPVNVAAEEGGNADISWTPSTDGPHTLTVKSKDGALNVSSTVTYQFNVGGAGFTSPVTGVITAGKVIVAPIGPAIVTQVTPQWRRGDADAWQNIPVSDVTYTNGGAVASWPLASTGGGAFPALNWDVAKTLNDAEAGADPLDGPLQMRGVFLGGTSATSTPTKLTYDKSMGQASSVSVGPGTVNLLTGNMNLGGGDVSVGGLGLTRSYNTRQAAKADGTGMFGPGWVSGYVNGAAPYTGLTVTGSLAQVALPDGSTLGFTKSVVTATTETLDPEVGVDGKSLVHTISGDVWTLSESDGGTSVFRREATDAAGRYTLRSVDPAGSTEAIVYAWESVTVDGQPVSRPTTIIGAAPSGVTCLAGALVRGCRAMTFTYATATTATGQTDGSWGDWSGRVRQVSFTAWDPDLVAMRTVVLGQYAYDNSGRLRAAWDPRLDHDGGQHVAVRYGYDASGILNQVTPQSQLPWTIEFGTVAGDSGAGRVRSVSRSALTAGTAVTTIAYKVPVSGSGAPYDLSAGQLARWGQTVIPVDATAVFPPSQVPASPPTAWNQAEVSYLDGNGREINSAQTASGGISTVWYDGKGNVVRELSPGNRKLALDASPSDNAAAEASIALTESTVNVYDTTGTLLLGTYEPMHDVVLANGSIVRGRAHVSYLYDEGAPAAEDPYGMVTTETADVRYWPAGVETSDDPRVTKSEYDWVNKILLKQIVDPAGLALATRYSYDSKQRIVSQTGPAGGASDTTPYTKTTVYYSAAANSTYPQCGNRPEWDGMACRAGLGGQPSSGAQLPSTVTTYDIYGSARTVTESTSAGALRTATMSYDAAGRVYETVLTDNTGALGTPVLKSRNIYDAATGSHTTTQSIDASGNVAAQVVRVYDSLGRQISYTDADGNVTTATYDLLSRPATGGDSRFSQTMTYGGGGDARGLPTGLTDSYAGAFTASYNIDGEMVTQTWPNGVVVSTTYDEAGAPTSVTYTQSGCGQPDCTLYTESAKPSGHDQTRLHSSTLSSQAFAYDRAGRVSRVEDTVNGQCTTRVSGYDSATNRTSLASYAPGAGGVCQATTADTNRSWSFDTADRAASAGYTYDTRGRTLTMPAADSAAGTAGSTMTYYVNDMVRSISSGGRTAVYTLDAIGNRFRSWTDNASGTAVTKVNHYANDSDTPTWTDEGGGQSSRAVHGIGGVTGLLTSGAGLLWQITNLHGDFVAGMTQTGLGLAFTGDYTETGVPRTSSDIGTKRYGWLGSSQRASDTPGGLTLMGRRLYAPGTGRFLSTDPVSGASASDYDYCNGDPVGCTDTTGQWPDCRSGSWISNRFTNTSVYSNGLPWIPYWQYKKVKKGFTLNIRCKFSHAWTVWMLKASGAAIGFAIGVALAGFCTALVGLCAVAMGALGAFLGSAVTETWYDAHCSDKGLIGKGTGYIRYGYTTYYWRSWAGGGTSTWNRYGYAYPGWPMFPSCIR